MLPSDCSRCQDSGYVCENHLDKAWPKECGAGMPCPDCELRAENDEFAISWAAEISRSTP